jgi:hypothetical protein
MTRVLLLLLLLLGLVRPIAAQETSPWIKYGKWGLLVVTVGFNLAASEANERANESFDTLTGRCLSDPRLCTVDDSGIYNDPTSEELYQSTLQLDTSSRRFLIAGQVALLGAAAMFIYEFTRPPGTPDDNIPFAPLVQDMGNAVGVGIEVNF